MISKSIYEYQIYLIDRLADTAVMYIPDLNEIH